MLASPALDRWLTDRSAQAASVERSAAARRAWQQAPELCGLAAALDRAQSDPDRVADIAFGLIADADVAHRFVRDMLAAMTADPFFTPPLRPIPGAIGAGVRLFDHPDLTLSLVTVQVDRLAAKKQDQRSARAIAFSGNLALRRIVRAGDAVVQHFFAEPAGPDFSIASHPSCRIGGERRLADGDLFIVDGRRESFTFAHARATIVYLECEVLAGAAPLRVEYDSGSLRPIAASSTDMGGSRAQMMLSALRSLQPSPDIRLYDHLLGDASFEVRWHAMRELMLTDAESGWSRLRRMAREDRHSELRETAARIVAASGAGEA